MVTQSFAIIQQIPAMPIYGQNDSVIHYPSITVFLYFFQFMLRPIKLINPAIYLGCRAPSRSQGHLHFQNAGASHFECGGGLSTRLCRASSEILQSAEKLYFSSCKMCQFVDSLLNNKTMLGLGRGKWAVSQKHTLIQNNYPAQSRGISPDFSEHDLQPRRLSIRRYFARLRIFRLFNIRYVRITIE